MKIKSDFVTNSSSCSYIILVNAIFNMYGVKKTISRLLENVTTIDCIKVIEGELQYSPTNKIDFDIEIEFKQTVEEIIGDGWDGGDSGFGGGPGDELFKGHSWLVNDVMNKHDRLLFKNGKLLFPSEWIKELDPDYIFKKYLQTEYMDLGEEE